MLRTIIALLVSLPVFAFAGEGVRIQHRDGGYDGPKHEGRYSDMEEIDDCDSNAKSAYPKPSICRFAVHGGYRSVSLSDVEAGWGFPQMPNGGWIMGYNFYYSTESFANFSPMLTPYKYIRLVQNNGYLFLEDAVIQGLPSNVPVYFRVSAVDDRGNEFYFTSDAAIEAECGSLYPLPPFDATNGGDFCRFAAVPYGR